MDDGSFGAGKRWIPRAFGWRLLVLTLLLFPEGSLSVRAQIDPEKRQLVHLGYNLPLQGKGPLAVYGFYYRNQPNFLSNSNLTLRLAVARLLWRAAPLRCRSCAPWRMACIAGGSAGRWRNRD